jgi:hypothetical protein
MTDDTASIDKTPKMRRTARNGGGPATRRNAKPGNAGYTGYEYQIEVTIWIALDLILAKQATDEITIEPRSDEDVEAAVRDPESALLDAALKGDRLDLVLQAKTRSRGPWTAQAIADVLLGKAGKDTGSDRKRSRPLSMLEVEPKRRYVFVTNESSVESLRPHVGDHLFDFPEVDDLPPHSRSGWSAEKRAALAPRVLLLTGVTEETLRSRIERLLEKQGHVPKSKHEACIRDLRDEVRSRIRGRHTGRWKRDELLAVLVQHGGSIAPIRDMDHYVRPSSYDQIKERLDKRHAVVIAGPSGTGKTLTADILELELRRGDPPFDVVGEEHGPGYVRGQLTRSDPVLFHLRDPWGGNRLMPGADRWSGELLKLIERAGSGRKFLVTSRSDVLESAGHELTKALAPYIVRIEIGDYGSARLAEIYNNFASDLTGQARVLSGSYRDEALAVLGRPYEIRRFIVALSREDEDAPRRATDLIAESQIDAISRVIAEQIAALGADGVQSAAILWSMLSARAAVPREVFAKLSRRLRTADPSFRPDVEGLIDFMVAGQNLRRDGSTLSFYHPRVEEGLRLALMKQRGEAEFLLGKVVDILVAWDGEKADWGRETALGVLRAADRVDGLDVEPSAATRTHIDGYLENVTLCAEKRFEFDRALRDLVKFGSADHVPSRLARILIEGSNESENLVLGDRWQVPVIDPDEKASLRADPRTRRIVERFIREVLPFTHRDYAPELVALLNVLMPDVGEAYWDAFDTVAGPGGPHENIDVIVRGTLAGDSPNYDRAIERFLRSNDEADRWMEAFSADLRRAEEHAVDADVADHILEEPSERYLNSERGMQCLVKLRREREGVQWIADHPRVQLLARALAEVLSNSSKKPDIDELRLLLDVSEGWTRRVAWSVVENHWDSALGHVLETELARSDLLEAGLRRRLVKIAAADSAACDLIERLAKSAPAATPERRLQLLHDLMGTEPDFGPKGEQRQAARREQARRLAATYPQSERELANALIEVRAGQDIKSVGAALSVEGIEQVERVLPSVPTDVLGPLACLAAAVGVDVGKAVMRLFDTADAQDGIAAIQATLIADGSDLPGKLSAALTHKRYPVRKEALELLIPGAQGAEERARLVETAVRDHSADVRLAFARQMVDYSWPEAMNALTELLQDTRNFASQLAPTPSWSMFSVARAAAVALGAYDTLPKKVIHALLRSADEASPDPFVGCAALSALATKDDDRVPGMLTKALGSGGLHGAPTHRPRAQAAAWASFDRALAGKLVKTGAAAVAMAEHEAPELAGPLLMAAGLTESAERRSLLEQLQRDGADDRAALVRLAAIVADKVEGIELDAREQILLRVVRGEPFDAFDVEHRGLLMTWCQGLDTGGGFDRFIAWIAQNLELPVEGSIGDIRAFDLPDRIKVMTMRSLSPHREQVDSDDGR